jgi:leucyl aminopeptidase
MKITAQQKITTTDLLCIFLYEKTGSAQLKKQFGKILADSLSKEILKRIKDKDFKGELGETLQIFVDRSVGKKIFLIGLGDGKKELFAKKAAGTAVKIGKKSKSREISFVLPKDIEVGKIISGAVGGNYEFKIGDTKKQFFVGNITLISTEKLDETKISRDLALAESVNTTRELINLPPNILTTEEMVERAKKLAKKYKNLSITILDQKKLKKLKMGGILAVGQGSDCDSYMVIFEYKGGKKKDKTSALVGKGVCFDSGGYNLKPTNHIETMKMDMGGAGTVLGIMEFLAKTKSAKNVIGVMGLVENMINGQAYRPDDIITMYSGQTCHITNTDAEGRLVLADCLSYVTEKYKPAEVFDFATLTGACIAALGYEITAIMGNNEKILRAIEKSAKKTEELVWELPITELFREKIKEELADLQNWTAGVSAGSSMAGAFLENFVRETPWCHFDIAGTAWIKTGHEYCVKGGTGAMVETVCDYFER